MAAIVTAVSQPGVKMASRSFLVLVALAAICLAFASSSATASDEAIEKGDIDCSGDVAVADATRLLTFLSGTDNAVASGCPFVITQLVEGHEWGDLDCTAGVGGSDVLSILLYAAGYEESPQSCPQIGDPAETGPGPVVCDMLFAASYRYTSQVYYKILAPAQDVTGAGIPQPHDFTSTFTAEVEDGVDRKAQVHNISWPNSAEFEIVIVGDRAWRKHIDWQELAPTGIYDPLPYEPATYCESLAPDLDTSLLSGTPDNLDGVHATRLDFQHFPNNWTIRNIDYGPGSDVTRYVDEFVGSIWIADDSRFVVRMDLQGTGMYEDGTILDVNITFDVRDLYDESIEIEPPVF